MDTNQNNVGQAQQGVTDLTPEEQSQALLADLAVQLDVFNEAQEEYIKYLEEARDLLKDLGKSEAEAEEELAKLKLRQKLKGDDTSV